MKNSDFDEKKLSVIETNLLVKSNDCLMKMFLNPITDTLKNQKRLNIDVQNEIYRSA